MLFEVIHDQRPLLALAVGLVVLAYIYRQRRLATLGRPVKMIPSKTFGIAEAQRLLRYGRGNRDGELWQEWFEELGHTVGLSILGTMAILTDDPENIKAVLATQFPDYGKGEQFHQHWKEFLGDSIFITDGKLWSDSRHLIRLQFMKDRVSDLHCFERHMQHMLTLIPNNKTIDISDLIYRFTLDSATDFLFGGSVNSLSEPTAEFARAFAELQRHMNNETKIGPMRYFMSRRRFRRNLKILNDFIEPFVDQVLMLRPGELKNRHADGYTFLHALAAFTRDHKMLRDQLVGVLLAARDTTAGTLSWTIYELSRRPNVVKKLRKEILERFGETAMPTYSDLKEMRYLQAVMNETLRLYPAVPFNIRTALKDTTLPHGGGESGFDPVGVAAGTSVVYSAYTMQRREDLFGPDVDEFKPERWNTWTPKPWHYVPFNGGPRICPGQQFALTEMGYVLVRLFQKFDTVENRQVHPQFCRCEITMSPGAGVFVAMREKEKEMVGKVCGCRM